MTPEQRAAIAQIAHKQLSLVALRQLLAIDLSYKHVDGAVRRGEWSEVQPNVFAPASCDIDAPRAVMAAVLAAGDGAVASHYTAAALRGLPGFALDRGDIHVTVPHSRRADCVKAVMHYSRALPPNHVLARGAIPTTSVARTLFDLGRLCTPKRLERAVDDAIAMRIVTVHALVRVLGDLAGPGRAGTVVMRELLEARGDGFVVPRSRLERRFLAIVQEEQLPTPRREIDLGSDEEWNGRVEFVFDHGVHVEVDGRRWHTALLDRRLDRQRDNEFIASGFAPLRFNWEDLRDRPKFVAEQIRRALATAARSGEDFRPDRAS